MPASIIDVKVDNEIVFNTSSRDEIDYLQVLEEYAITNQNPSASYHPVARNRRDVHQ